MGSIGYLLKKGKDNPNGQVIINIDKVIIKGIGNNVLELYAVICLEFILALFVKL
nr:MAG: hypothetical protein [Bacteriophage sp.]